jgi:hypothetical protein
MSLDAYLNQISTITRNVQSGTDRYNNATTVPMVVDAEARCRKTQKTMRVLKEDTAEYAYVHADLLLFGAGVNVLSKDIVTIGEQAWRVTQVFQRMRANEQHHVSCMVEAINA